MNEIDLAPDPDAQCLRKTTEYAMRWITRSEETSIDLAPGRSIKGTETVLENDRGGQIRRTGSHDDYAYFSYNPGNVSPLSPYKVEVGTYPTSTGVDYRLIFPSVVHAAAKAGHTAEDTAGLLISLIGELAEAIRCHPELFDIDRKNRGCCRILADIIAPREWSWIKALITVPGVHIK